MSLYPSECELLGAYGACGVEGTPGWRRIIKGVAGPGAEPMSESLCEVRGRGRGFLGRWAGS